MGVLFFEYALAGDDQPEREYPTGLYCHRSGHAAQYTPRQRRAHAMIFMADGVRVKLDQSPKHPLIPTFEVGNGEPSVGAGFPVSMPE